MLCPHCRNEVSRGVTKCIHCHGDIVYDRSGKLIIFIAGWATLIFAVEAWSGVESIGFMLLIAVVGGVVAGLASWLLHKMFGDAKRG